MTERHLAAEIARLWPKIPDDHISLIWGAVRRLPIDDGQVTAALNAEFFRPANKVPVHQRIVSALKAEVPSEVKAADAGADGSENARLFRSIRLAGGYPADWSASAVLRHMHGTMAMKAARMYGAVSDSAISDAAWDYSRFTTLDPLDVDAELTTIYGPERMEEYHAAKGEIRTRMAERRVSERDLVKTAKFQTSSKEERLKMIQAIVNGTAGSVREAEAAAGVRVAGGGACG